MARVLMPLPKLDFDPTEVAVSWLVLRRLGHSVVFATPDGHPGQTDDIMLTGRGLDFWSRVPGLKHLTLVGRILGANADARAAYADMSGDPAFATPITWRDADVTDFDGLLLPGGHRARGMRDYLESEVLQRLVARFFETDRPVAAICHGVVLAARSRTATGRSVLYGRRTTALTWSLERTAWRIGRVTRFWDPLYYRTYPDGDEPAGHMSVEHEVRRALASPEDFIDVPADATDRERKLGGRHRDSWTDGRPGFVVRDGKYVSARWPGDAYSFARCFADLLPVTTADTAPVHAPA